MDWLRRADWLTHERVRGYALLLALASLGLVAISFWRAMPPGTTDFLAFWGAGQVTAAGEPAAAYDLAAQQQVQTSTGSPGVVWAQTRNGEMIEGDRPEMPGRWRKT